MRIQRTTEQGATLIAVLLILLLVTILGTLAIRQGLVSLNISTNSQAKSLLLQNSDSAIYTLENPSNIDQNLSGDHFLGIIIRPENASNELVFCYSGTATTFFDFNNASFINWDAGNTPTNNSLGTSGYCDSSNASGYTSGRRSVLTQVAVKIGGVSTQPFDGNQQGTEAVTANIMQSKPITIFSTSILPAMSSVTTTKINSCLSAHMSDVTVPDGATVAVADADGITADDSVTDCLAKLKVPVSTQVSEYRLEQGFTN